jgi:hypothetical protein
MWKIKVEAEIEVDPGWDMDNEKTRAYVLGDILGKELEVYEGATHFIEQPVGALKVLKHLKVSKDAVVQADVARGGAA